MDGKVPMNNVQANAAVIEVVSISNFQTLVISLTFSLFKKNLNFIMIEQGML